jgi:hypothetical protein
MLIAYDAVLEKDACGISPMLPYLAITWHTAIDLMSGR